MKTVCMVTTRHNPGDPRIFEKESKSLVGSGYRVIIVVPEGEIPRNTEGVEFRTFPKIQGIFRKVNTIIQVYRCVRQIPADYYHCHEIDVSLLIGWIMKRHFRERNPRLIFDCHEFWLGFFSFRMHPIVRYFFKPLFLLYERWIIRKCDGIITANSIERAYYQIREPTKPIVAIYNVAPLGQSEELIKNGDKEPLFDLCFEGYLNFDRGLKELFHLMLRLRDRYQKIRLLVVGKLQGKDSEEWGKNFISKHKLEENIHITGWVPFEEIFLWHKRCRIGIFLYLYTPNNLLAGPPNKLFNFMRSGIPVVASRLPETVNIVHDTECGLVVNPYKLDEVEKAVVMLLENRELRQQMGQNGRNAIQSIYNWEHEKKKLLTFYRELGGTEEESDSA